MVYNSSTVGYAYNAFVACVMFIGISLARDVSPALLFLRSALSVTKQARVLAEPRSNRYLAALKVGRG